MKNNSTTTILNAFLGLCLVASVILCLQFVFVIRETRALNSQMVSISAYNNGIRALAADCVKYSEANPAINPILQTVGLAKPAAK